MPTSPGRRALVASLLMLLAWLSSGVVAAWAEDAVTDPAPETTSTTETTVGSISALPARDAGEAPGSQGTAAAPFVGQPQTVGSVSPCRLAALS